MNFLVIGSLAALIHLSVLKLCVAYRMVANPLLANIFAWFIAFSFSFFGHFYRTFKSENLLFFQSLKRFIALSFLGFLINQMLYHVLLTYTHIHYMVAMFFILLCVALLTYCLSKYWAFRI